MASNTKIKNLRKLLKKQGERNKCRFTRARVREIDYKDIPTLQKMVSAQGKLYGRKRTGTEDGGYCWAHPVGRGLSARQRLCGRYRCVPGGSFDCRHRLGAV